MKPRFASLSLAAIAAVLGIPGLIQAQENAEILAVWDFESVNDLIGAHAGTLSGGAELIPDGWDGQGLNVASSPNAVMLVDGSFINAAGAIDAVTIAFWQKNTQPVKDQSVFWLESESSDGSSRGISAHTPWSNNRIYFDTSGCCLATQRTDEAAPPDLDWDVWNHFAFVKEGPLKRIYVNGVLLIERENLEPLKEDFSVLHIGNDVNDGSNAPVTLDDFAIWAGALTQEEVAELADGGSPLFDTSDPGLTLPKRADLGQVPATPSQHSGSFQIRNPGESQTLTVTGVVISGANSANFTIDTAFPLEVPPREKRPIDFTFDSLGGQGLFTAIATLNSNDVNAEDPNEIQLIARVLNLNGPIAHYTMNEESGTEVLDASGSGRDGTLVGGPLLAQPGLTAGTGTSIEFSDGSHLVVAGDKFDPFDSFSVVFWANPEALAAAPIFSTLFGTGADNPTFALLETEGALTWFVDSGGNAAPEITSDPVLAVGETAHIGLTYSNTAGARRMAMYVNGEEVAAKDDPFVFADDRSNPFFVGSYGGELGFTGRFDDFQIYGRALGATDLALLRDNPGETLGTLTEVDSDADGLTDVEEVAAGTNPLIPDTDGDGLLDGDEVITHETNALVKDTDGGGTWDGFEVRIGTDPLDALDDPAVWTVRIVEGGTDIANIATAHAWLEDETLTNHLSQQLTLNYLGNACQGEYPDPIPFDHMAGPGDNKERFVVEAKTRIFIENTGPYTFGFGSDDGGYIDVGMRRVAEFNANRGRGVTLGTIDLTPGFYEVTALMWENGGGDCFDVFWAPGTHASFDVNTFALLEGTGLRPADADGDGMDDNWELANFGDLSLDGTGDADGDGLTDKGEHDATSDPHAADTDGDGLADGVEVNQTMTDPTLVDTDDDGLSDGVETNTGVFVSAQDTGTDPLNPDTDGDTFDDGLEVGVETDPNNPADNPLSSGEVLLAWWNFNDASNAAVTADNTTGKEGQLLDGAAFTADAGGRTGQAGDRGMDFGTTSASQRVMISNADFINIAAEGDQFTVSFWQRLHGVANTSSFWAASPSSNNGERGIQAHVPWGDGNIYYDSSGCCDSPQRIAGNPLTLFDPELDYSQWHHFAFVKNGGVKQIWIDGELFLSDMEQDAAPMPKDFTNLFLGSDLNGGNSLQGILDDFAFYSVALSGDAIGDLADGASPDEIGGGGGGAVGPYQLFSYWDFNTPSDVATLDVVNGFEGELMGAVISDDSEGQSGAAGDRSLRLGNVGNETVRVEDTTLFNIVAGQDVVTVAFWQKLDTVLDQTTFKGQSPSTTTGAERGFSVHTPWSDGVIYYDTAGCCAAGTQRLNGAPGIDFLEWHHFAFVKNGGIKEIWIDGERFLQGVSPAADPLPEDFTALWIGSAIDGMESMHGLLDDFAMFATALDAGAMQQLAAGVRPDELVPAQERADVTAPGDPVVLVNGENDGDADAGPPPGAEGVENAINNITQKYLNFLDLGSGLVVTPSMGGTVVTGLRFYTANDSVPRDPASYRLEGSTSGPSGPFALISEGNLALPDDRNPGGNIAVDTSLFHQEVDFANTTAYFSYRLTFPTLKDAATANSMQIAEVELLGVPGEVIVVPDEDSDGDGVSDASEVLAGTDPNNANDYLRVVAASNSGTEVLLEWASVEGKLYDIEYSTDQESWIVINAEPIAGAAGGMTSFQDTDAGRLGEPEGYYRAVVRN